MQLIDHSQTPVNRPCGPSLGHYNMLGLAPAKQPHSSKQGHQDSWGFPWAKGLWRQQTCVGYRAGKDCTVSNFSPSVAI